MSIRSRLGLLVLAMLGGCVTQDVKLDHRHVEAPSKRALMGAEDCRLPPFELRDVRDYQGMGWIGGHELLYPDLGSWLHGAIEAATEPEAGAPPLLIELNRAYIESHPSSHTFQLVLRARRADAGESGWRVYRGNTSGITWWGNRGEFGNYVENAGRLAIQALVRAEGNCSRPARRR